jgi:enterochelin esterase family protein
MNPIRLVCCYYVLAVGIFTTPLIAQSPQTERSVSPRILALQKELEQGRSNALTAFWSEIAKKGAPLIEPIEGDSAYALVTFIWRAEEEHKYIAVFPLARPNPLPHLMSRLPGTDLWYKCYRLKRDARFEYQISVNDSLAPFAAEKPAETGGWLAAMQPDPLNQNRFVTPRDPEVPGRVQYIDSVVELADAPAQPFVNPRSGTPKGQVDLVRYESKRLKNTRRLWVYTPPAYKKSHQPYSLLVLFDGWQYNGSIPTPTILDNMIADGQIPPLVAVMVDQVDRFKELAQNPVFSDFISDELMPWVRQNYDVTKGPDRTIIGGLSLGGLAAAYTAMRHPEVFGNVLSQSGSFQLVPEGTKQLIRQFVETPKLPINFYLEAGLLETGDSPSLLHSNRNLRDVLEAKGYVVTYSDFNGRHDAICWRGSLSKGLISLLGSHRPITRR